MAETIDAPPSRISAIRYFYRRFGKWQWRSLIAAVVATVGGFAGFVQQKFSDAPSSAQAGVSHTAMMAGLAFLIAFAFFFWVRSFLKWGAMLIATLIAAAATISYFTGFNIDLSSVKDGYDGVSGWIWHQCTGLISLVTSNISSAASATVGGWMGAKRSN